MRGRTPRRRLLALVGLVLIVGASYVALERAGIVGRSGDAEPAEILAPPDGVVFGTSQGDIAPDFIVSDLVGNRHQLSDLRGTPVLLNFWASWCLPCAFEMPDLAQFQDMYRDEIAVVAVNRGESTDRARSYLEDVTLPNGSRGADFALVASDPADAVYDAYRALGMPASFFIDSSGRISHIANGPIVLEQMEEALATTP